MPGVAGVRCLIAAIFDCDFLVEVSTDFTLGPFSEISKDVGIDELVIRERLSS